MSGKNKEIIIVGIRNNINEWRYRKFSLGTIWMIFLYFVANLILIMREVKAMEKWVDFIKSVDLFDNEFRRSYWVKAKSRGLSPCAIFLGIWLFWISTTGLVSRLLSCHSLRNPTRIIIRIAAVLTLEGLDFFYIAVCLELKSRYNKLEYSFIKRLSQKHYNNLDHTIDDYRTLHRSLGNCITNLNAVFGAAGSLKFLLEIPPRKLTQTVRFQLTLFLWQLKLMDTSIIGAGIIKINKGLIGTCATYFIAVVQLSPEINNLSGPYFNFSVKVY